MLVNCEKSQTKEIRTHFDTQFLLNLFQITKLNASYKQKSPSLILFNALHMQIFPILLAIYIFIYRKMVAMTLLVGLEIKNVK